MTQNILVKDANQAPQQMDTTVLPNSNQAPSGSIIDVTSGNKASVTQLHNSDQQTLGGTSFGVVTGGLTSLLSPAGLLNRSRQAASDNIPSMGIAADANLLNMRYLTLSGTGTVVGAGSAVITPGSGNMSGTIGGVPWSIQVGSVLIYDFGGANQEVVEVTAVSATTFTAVFAKTHSANVTVIGFALNNARDAAGELNGASGAGTGIALAYESNGGHPAGTFDQERNIQGKGVATGAITTATQTAITLTMTSAPTGLQAGAQMILTGGTAEMVYVASNYTLGSTTVPLTSAILQTSHTNATWDIFALNGPGASQFYPDGIGLDGVALTDPVNGLHSQLRQSPGNPGVAMTTAEPIKATFRYAGLAFAPVATPTDILVIQGSATKTVRIKRIKLSGVATAQGNMPAQLARRSTAGTLGSAVLTAVTAGKHDTGDAAATAVVSTVGTANYTTLGTLVALEGVGRLGMPAAATGATGQDLVWDFATRQDKAMILRGVSDFLCVNLNGAAIPAGGVVDFEIEQEEDAS